MVEVVRRRAPRSGEGKPSLGAGGRKLPLPVSVEQCRAISARWEELQAAQPPDARAWARAQGYPVVAVGAMPRAAREAFQAAYPGAVVGPRRTVTRPDAIRAILEDGAGSRAAYPGRACLPDAVATGPVTEVVRLSGRLSALVDTMAAELGVSAQRACRMLLADGLAARIG